MTRTCPRCRKSYDRSVQFCPDDGASVMEQSVLAPAVAEALAPDYRIRDWLGSGGMGEVFAAEQTRVGNRRVALKLLHRRFSDDAEFIARFQNEAASTGRINHPNVITIYESKQAPDGTLYIAMELVDGESLTERMRRAPRLSVDEVVEIVAQCGKALQAAHRLGIIHRDVKPDNIMLTRDADGAFLVKVLDFGIAKLRDAGEQTAAGNVLGTPAYMSYEQASGLGSDKLDGRSDIYSLGVVAYQMLAGHPPFRADTPIGYISKHLSEAPAPLRDLRPEIGPALEAAVHRALEKDRERRYQTAADFVAAIREAARSPQPAPPAATAPGPAGDPTPAASAVPPWRARRTPTDVGVGVLPSAPAATPTSPPDGAAPRPAATGASPAGLAWPPAVEARAAPAGPERPRREAGPAEWRSGESPKGPPRAGSVSRGAERDEVAGLLTAAAWGLRHAASWGMQAAIVICVVRFAWSVVAPLIDSATAASVEAWGRPWGQPVAGWLPALPLGGFDIAPLIAAVGLVILRPRVVQWLADAEARWRAPVRRDGVPG
jgi:serine/threonine-protein kinase